MLISDANQRSMLNAFGKNTHMRIAQGGCYWPHARALADAGYFRLEEGVVEATGVACLFDLYTLTDAGKTAVLALQQEDKLAEMTVDEFREQMKKFCDDIPVVTVALQAIAAGNPNGQAFAQILLDYVGTMSEKGGES